MVNGDLTSKPLWEVLTDLAGSEASGCLHVDDGNDEALVYLKDGNVYSIYVPGRRPQLGARLVSSGALEPEALEEALDAQLNELQGWRLGELLVHLGYVERSVVENFTMEQLREGYYDLSKWDQARWRFRKSEKTREDLGASCTVEELFQEAERRDQAWAEVNPVIGGRNGVPELSANGPSSAEMTLDQDQWALLCKVDGRRNVAELARDCGFTDFEAGQIVYGLSRAGLVEIPTGDADEDEADVPAMGGELGALAATLASRLGGGTSTAVQEAPPSEDWESLVGDLPASDDSELSRLLGRGSEPDEPPSPFVSVDFGGLGDPEPEPEPEPEPVEEAESLTSVSSALSALLDELPGGAPVDDELPTLVPSLDEPDDEQARAERSRAAAAAELAEMHTLTRPPAPPSAVEELLPAPSLAESSLDAAERAFEQAAQGRRDGDRPSRRGPAEEIPPYVPVEDPAPAEEPAFAALAEPLQFTPLDEAEPLVVPTLSPEPLAPAAYAPAETTAAAFADIPPPPPPAAAPPPPANWPAADQSGGFFGEPAAPAADAPPPMTFNPPAAGETRGLGDTASLLRELSSLGLEDQAGPASSPPPPPPARPANRPTPPPAKGGGKDKKKGLFGR